MLYPYLFLLTPVLFDLPFMPDRGHMLPPDGAWLKQILKSSLLDSVDIACAVFVNPTYHGYSTDLKELISQIHSFDWPVLVDESHGAHFACGVDQKLPCSAIEAGADLVVHSLHKSASGLAQSAVLWAQGSRVQN